MLYRETSECGHVIASLSGQTAILLRLVQTTVRTAQAEDLRSAARTTERAQNADKNLVPWKMQVCISGARPRTFERGIANPR